MSRHHQARGYHARHQRRCYHARHTARSYHAQLHQSPPTPTWLHGGCTSYYIKAPSFILFAVGSHADVRIIFRVSFEWEDLE
jgi:hypothetical protein